MTAKQVLEMGFGFDNNCLVSQVFQAVLYVII